MEDQFSKYLRLFGTIFFTFLGFIVAIALLLLGFRLLFGLVSYIPWFTYVYMIIILLVPPALFITVYLIYFKRTKVHPSRPVRLISYILFSVALIAWAFFLVGDMIRFFKSGYTSIDRYNCFNLLFLFCNVEGIFFIGVMQALTTAKEKDWMEKHLQ